MLSIESPYYLDIVEFENIFSGGESHVRTTKQSNSFVKTINWLLQQWKQRAELLATVTRLENRQLVLDSTAIWKQPNFNNDITRHTPSEC